MHCVDLIANALPGEAADLPEPPSEGVCCLTGAVGPTLPKKLAIKDSFTQLDQLRAPGSDRIGVPAWRALTYSVAEQGKKRDLAPLRQSHWLISWDGLKFLESKAEIRPHVFGQPPSSPWAGYITTSYKKHGCLMAPVNVTRRRWLFETVVVDCSDMHLIADWWARLREAQDAGLPRSVIESPEQAGPSLIAKLGLAWWRDWSAWAKLHCSGPLYSFLCYLLPSQEELKEGFSEPV